ncbi:MAG: hypothetical protein GY913_09030 [Proteobacteria bacterium]|nr:hypothetical protein [Pseudomonadota bacterium]MCP4917054.1 hypothetical protein [Pseudomonadota bacterium]
MKSYDPFRLDYRAEPEPVPGHVQPAARLVDEDDDLLHYPRFPTWVRVSAAAMAVGFFIATALTAAASGGTYSLLTDSWLPPLEEPDVAAR